jgi:hypothetical protein
MDTFRGREGSPVRKPRRRTTGEPRGRSLDIHGLPPMPMKILPGYRRRAFPRGGPLWRSQRRRVDDRPVAEQLFEDPAVLHRKTQVRVLSSLAAGEDDVFELMSVVAPYDVPHHFTPDVALLEVAATALGLACPPGHEPLEYEGLTDRYLSDQLLTGRTLHHRTRFAIYAAACLRGGLLPDLLGEAGGWQPRLWTYAVSAVVLYTRAAAERLGQTVPQIAVGIAEQRDLHIVTGPQSIG